MEKKIDYSKPHKISKSLEDRMLAEAKCIVEVIKTTDEKGKIKYVPANKIKK